MRILRHARGWMMSGLALALSLLPPAAALAADEGYAQDAVEAAYLHRFAGYVEWPEGTLAGHAFVIAVYDAHGVAQELRRLLPAHPIHGQPAQVREITRLEDVGAAQILYVGTGHSDFLRAFAAYGKRPILLVTADEHGLDFGGMLNFVTLDKRVRFEISLSAAEGRGLKISSDLLAVAVRVHVGRPQSDHLYMPSGPPGETAQYGLASLRDKYNTLKELPTILDPISGVDRAPGRPRFHPAHRAA